MNDALAGHLTPDQIDELLESDPPRSAAFHLETCADCRELLASEREVVAALKCLAPIDVPIGFANRVMERVSLQHPEFARSRVHITNAELDAWLDNTLASARMWHLEECAPCLALAEAERDLVKRLEALPLFSPKPRFGAQVMSKVAVVESTGTFTVIRRKILASPRTALIAASAAALLVGGVGSSIGWSLTHRDTLTQLGQSVMAQGSQWLWLGVRGIVSNLIEQPWYASARHALGTPTRLAWFGALTMAAWSGGLVAMRRLLTVPGARGSRAA